MTRRSNEFLAEIARLALAGTPLRCIARAVGVSPETIRRYLDRRRLPRLTHEEAIAVAKTYRRVERRRRGAVNQPAPPKLIQIPRAPLDAPIEIPRWVPPDLALAYRYIAEASGEEIAASIIRKRKAAAPTTYFR